MVFFAWIDGNIFVDKGLLVKLGGPQAIAAILAHELAHVHLRHWEAIYSRMSLRVLYLFPLVVFPFGGTSPPHNFDSLMKFPYTETQEKEANLFA